MRRLTYEKVKGVFTARGYELLSTEYVNCEAKLEYKCPKGHLGSITYSNFRRKKGCHECSREKSAYTYDEVRRLFNGDGYELLSLEYKNCRHKLFYKCPNGHVGSMSYNSFQQNKRCPECDREKRAHKYEEIKYAFEARGFTLLSPTYVNNCEKLYYMCPKGHHGSTTYACFQQAPGCCPECNRENRALSYEYVQQAFKARGYTLLSTEYVNNCTKLYYECPNGHLGSMDYSHFQSGCGCPICADSSHISKISQEWLDSLGIPNVMGVYREVSLAVKGRLLRVDGFDPETNTVYEFLGDYYHGNPEKFNFSDVNKTTGKSFGQLYQETLSRLEAIKQAGYNLVYIWEKDFYNRKKQTTRKEK